MARVYRTKRKSPTYRRKRRVYRRRGVHRRRRAVPKALSLTMAPAGLPSQLYMKHHYRLNAANLTDTSFGYKQVVIRLNSMFDPEYAVGGAQPTLRDNMFYLYNYARVVKTKVTAYFYNTGGMHARCGIVYTTSPGDAPFNVTSSNDPMALPRDRASFTTLTEYGGSKTMAKLTKTFNLKHFESDLFSSVNFRQDSGADPNKVLYAIIGAQCVVGNNDLQCRCEIDLEFTVRWEDPINTEMATLD